MNMPIAGGSVIVVRGVLTAAPVLTSVPNPDWLTVTCCVSQGHDLPTAVSNIREAILLCLEVRRADGLAPVAETPELIAREIQEYLEDRAAEGLPLIDDLELRHGPCSRGEGRNWFTPSVGLLG